MKMERKEEELEKHGEIIVEIVSQEKIEELPKTPTPKEENSKIEEMKK